MYSQQLLEHFHHPRNVGEIADPTAVAEISNPACGDVMKLWLVMRDGRVRDAGYKVQGCVPAVACGSWLTEAIKGRTLEELKSLSADQIEAGLGELPPASHHASALAIGALRQAVANLAK